MIRKRSTHTGIPTIPPEFDVDWLADLTDVPPDARWPRLITRPHPHATGSYGLDVEAHMLDRFGLNMRWWQRLALRMEHQHDASGRLLIRQVIESTPRRAGKSYRLRAGAMWRLEQADRFGEEQLILMTGKDLPICREIQRKVWPWARAEERKQRGWGVRQTNGQEEVSAPDGSRWMIRGRDSVYGYDVTKGLVDEAWGVEPGVVDDGLEPATLERSQPQLVLTSTAHRRATALMRTRIAVAEQQLDDPGDLLLMLWAADPDADLKDRAQWRAASPHWSDDRERMIGQKLQRALLGEQLDPDEPDPLAAFRSQYLNIWPMRMQAPVGDPAMDVNRWLRAVRPGARWREGAPLWGGVDVTADGQDLVLVAFGRDEDGRPLAQVARWEPTADQRRVADLLADWHRMRPNLQGVGFDPRTCATAANWAQAEGVPMAPVDGARWGQALRDLRDRLPMLGHPHAVGDLAGDVLLRHMAAARTRQSGETEVLSRAVSRGPVSGVVALMCAVHVAGRAPELPAFRIM